MGVFDTILAILQAIAAYIKYKFDPATIAKQAAITQQTAEENGYASVDELLASSNTIALSSFISQYLRMRPEETDSATGRATDLLIGSLPKPRNQSDIDSDPHQGLSG